MLAVGAPIPHHWQEIHFDCVFGEFPLISLVVEVDSPNYQGAGIATCSTSLSWRGCRLHGMKGSAGN